MPDSAKESFEAATPSGNLDAGAVGTIFTDSQYQSGTSALVISAASPFQGTQHARYTGGTGYAVANRALGSSYSDVYTKLFFKVVTSPADSVNAYIWGTKSIATQCGIFGVRGQPSGGPKLRCRTVEQFGPGVDADSSTQLTVGQWYRADFYYTQSSGVTQVRLYTGSTIASPDTADALETIATGSASGASFSKVGVGSDYSGGGVVDIDGIAYDTAAMPAPLTGMNVRSGGSWVAGTPKVRVGGAWVCATEVKYRTGGAWVSSV
jgi:hypothetical protein